MTTEVSPVGGFRVCDHYHERMYFLGAAAVHHTTLVPTLGQREAGEVQEKKLSNGDGEAEHFYCTLPAPSLIGIEASGNTQWFEEMLERFGHEVWIGDAAKIRASFVRKQKTDCRDAAHILMAAPDCTGSCRQVVTGFSARSAPASPRLTRSCSLA